MLINLRASLLSAGTERSKVEAGRASLVGKARARPDQARQVLEKARRDGLRDTVQAVRSRLDLPTPLGYSAAGVVIGVGAAVRDLTPGDPVACGGDGAVHAEVVHVPGNLCAVMPEGVDFRAACFATVGSVALHGLRQADVRLGERVAVVGLGLVGQLTAQVARAAGCGVVGFDVDEDLLRLTRELGSVDAAHAMPAADASYGPHDGAYDAVIVTAATRTNDPIRVAPRLCRDRGRVVIVGAVGLGIERESFYEREVDLRFSRSYGPGRYDREYEERGLDYPIGYVRWTERRNMAAFLHLLAQRRVDVSGLISQTFPIEEAPTAYDRLVSDARSPLGIVLEYPATPSSAADRPAPTPAPGHGGTWRKVNVIGAGSFAQRVLIPALQRSGFQLGSVASATGLSARGAASRFAFERTTTPDDALADNGAGLVAIATRHASHGPLAERALRAGKVVFVEKPPCLTYDELLSLSRARDDSRRHLFVGFNRRHAPLAPVLRDFVRAPEQPIDLLYRVSAGRLPLGHWLNDPQDGGGRLVGEGCHFIDFACWLIGARPSDVQATMRAEPGEPVAAAQSFVVMLRFADSSTATVLYTAAGAGRIGKEYIEAHSAGRTARLSDFRQLDLVVGRRRRRHLQRSGDKGHVKQFEHMAAVLSGAAEEIQPDPLLSMRATLDALQAALSSSELRLEEHRDGVPSSG